MEFIQQRRILIFFFLAIASSSLQPSIGQDDCRAVQCRKNGPIVRFPFRLKDRQPQHCGYPGFDLSCSDFNEPVLVLPDSVELYIKQINYSGKVIHVQEHGGCLTRIRHLNLTAAPFSVSESSLNFNLTILSCPSAPADLDPYKTCLIDPALGQRVYAIGSQWMIDGFPIFSCTKMYNLSGLPSDNLLLRNYDLKLDWPSEICRHCDSQRKYCRFVNNSLGNQTECYAHIELPNGKTALSMEARIALTIAGLFLLSVAIAALGYAWKVRKDDEAKIEKFLLDYRALRPARYSYADIKKITHNFKNKLGQGAYGIVYKGTLSNDVHVAIKMLNSWKGNGDDFVNEVGIMAKIHHVNIVRLVGYCADGWRRALVYEFLPNDSLEKYISSDKEKSSLGWKKLESIALGVANGIEYLHQGCEQRILHFDIKPHNILLDQDLDPKVSDFGQAKLCSKEQSAVSMTTARGTVGYIAPEVFSRNFGSVSYKSDVYSFGMLLLGMVGGQKNMDASQICYPEWVYNQLDGGEELRIQVVEDGDDAIIRKLAIVGLWCIQWHPADRPSMKVVVQMLEGNGSSLTIPSNPFLSTNYRTTSGKLPFNNQLEAIAE